MTFLKKLFRWFISGIIVLLPLGATLILIGWVINFLDQIIGGQSIFARAWQTTFGFFGVGSILALVMGYLLMFAVIIVVGYFATEYAKNRISLILRGFFGRIPIINKIYGSVEQVIELWSKKDQGEEVAKVGEVVMVNFSNTKALGILSSRNTYRMDGEDHYLVYLPSAPVPATGFTYFLKASDVHFCGTKMDDMTKVIVSLGVLGQEVLGKEIQLSKVGDAPPPSAMPAPQDVQKVPEQAEGATAAAVEHQSPEATSNPETPSDAQS